MSMGGEERNVDRGKMWRDEGTKDREEEGREQGGELEAKEWI